MARPRLRGFGLEVGPFGYAHHLQSHLPFRLHELENSLSLSSESPITVRHIGAEIEDVPAIRERGEPEQSIDDGVPNGDGCSPLRRS